MIRNHKKIAVLLWLYHTDLAEEFYELLKDFSDFVDIYLSLCEDNDNNIALQTLNKLNNIKSISYYPNCGADIYSFINEVHKIDSDTYPYFIKIHSKKSTWGSNKHCNWRCILLDSLIGNKQILSRNIDLMEKKDANYLSTYSMTYMDNNMYHEKQIHELLKLLGFSTETKDKKFNGGNMFMGRTKFYQDTLAKYKEKILDLISKERGKINERYGGTYCHAMERIFGYMVDPHKFVRAPLDTIKIKTSQEDTKKTKLKYLHFRKLYNNDIYCIEQPNIYGTLDSFNEDSFTVAWKHISSTKLATYQRICKNTYCNIRYIYQK